MSPHIDAHAHFFLPGFASGLPENCRRVSPDEITLYAAYATHHEISQVLAIGYEGATWAVSNNAYLATLASQFSWVRPLAFIADPSQLTVKHLDSLQAQKFVGITLYLFTAVVGDTLSSVHGGVWQWLSDHGWLISVNSSDDHWSRWEPILSQYPDLCLLIAHLGLPSAVTNAPTPEDARSTLKHVLRLASFPNTYVKYSGFYALAEPGYAYPHSASWPYAQAISKTFGTSRLLWASDFSPALEHVSFPQTVEVIAAMPWLTEADRSAIYHDNLANLLAAIEERIPTK